MKKALIIIGILVLLSAFALSQTAITHPTMLNKSCVWVDEGWDEKIPVINTISEMYKENGTSVVRDEIVTYNIIHHEDWVLKCKPFLRTEFKDIDFLEQNYNCRVLPDKTVECDSRIDGNGDGKCDPNGGETCCKVIGRKITCKNSIKEWVEKDYNLVVDKLK